MVPDDKTVTAKVIEYKKLLSENEEEKASALFDNICDDVCVMSYYLPQTELNLPKEDAADFVLYFRKNIPGIVAKYDTSKGNIIPYLFYCIKMKYRSFVKYRRRMEEIENALELNSAFLMKDDDPTLLIAEDECVYGSNPKSEENVRFIRYLFKERKFFRKCFFVYLISLAPDLTETIMDRVTDLFSIDYMQTKTLVDKIMPAYLKKETIKAKHEKIMNINWIKSIRKWDNEEIRDKHSETVSESSDRIKRGYKLPRNAISELLNESRTTIFSSIYKIRKVFLYLETKSGNGGPLLEDEITSLIDECYTSDTWRDVNVKLSTFKPFEEFNISI